MTNVNFMIGFVAGLLVAQTILVTLFFWYGHKARKAIRKHLDNYEKSERARRQPIDKNIHADYRAEYDAHKTRKGAEQ